MNISPVGAEMFYVTYRHMTKFIVAFRKFANSSGNTYVPVCRPVKQTVVSPKFVVL